MRTDIPIDRPGWLFRLDYKKLILIVFLLRIITACAYDIFVTVTDKDFILPDSKFYSLRGRYVSLVMEGYNDAYFPEQMLPRDEVGKAIFVDTVIGFDGKLPSQRNEMNVYSYIIGALYFVFGSFTIWVRLFNIILSILSVYLFFDVAKRTFGDITANLFLIIALFLPTQFAYSITLSRDFLRVFALSLTIWVIYRIFNIGDIWVRKLRLQ